MLCALAAPSFTMMRDILFVHSEYHLDYGHAGCYAMLFASWYLPGVHKFLKNLGTTSKF